MNDPPTVVLDACVLVPIRLTTVLLWLAEDRVFQPLWSDTILDEVERNLPNVGVTEDAAERRVAVMRSAFGSEALVEGYQHVIGDLTCDAKDRHVLAAAITGGAEAIVTFNVKDFPDDSITPYGIRAIDPDTFLLHLLSTHLATVTDTLDRGAKDLRRPPKTATEFLADVARTVPTFANIAADAFSEPSGSLSPVPALVRDDSVPGALGALGKLDDFSDPAQVATAWWVTLTDDLDSARHLTFYPPAWGDFRWAAELLADRSLASRVVYAVDAPAKVAFMRFVPEVADSARVFQSFQASMVFLTLVRIDDGTWRVWGLGPRLRPAHEVLGD